MPGLNRFQNRKVGVLGLARSGLAAGRALREAGADVLAWDDNAEALGRAGEHGLMPGTDAQLPTLAALVVSPGIPLTHPTPHPLLRAARKAGVPLTCDIDLFADVIGDRRVVGVTGTNGKSTTSALIHHLLVAAGRDAALGGNIGRAVFDLGVGGPDRIFVLELSSFQLDLCERLRPRVACWLNLTPDHLDRHGHLEGYRKAKLRIFREQQAEDVAVIGVDDEPSREVFDGLTGPRRVPASAQHPVLGGVACLSGRLIDAMEGPAAEVASLDGIASLRGAHNGQNAAVAYAAVRALGLTPDESVRGLASYPGLPHRMEEVASRDGVLWINDSKATNPDAAARSLGAFGPLFWIAGGKPKPGGFRSLRPYLSHVHEAFLIGAAADEIAADVGDIVPVTKVGSLDAAVAAAGSAAVRSGHNPAIVLLAPACASFDQFRSFEHRGDEFRRLAQAWTQSGAAA
jgi:UDP-N-acetylmuramoylalanine--D-glutamate ligase